jgi:hypothetical protein
VLFRSSTKDAVLVFTEPSHKLLLAVLSPAFAEKAQGKAYRAQARAAGGCVAITSVAGAEPRMVVPARPGADLGVLVATVADEEEKVIADARVGSGDFGFASYQDGPLTTHCCECCGCEGLRCIDCEGNLQKFTCCPAPGCEIMCGWQVCP